MRIGLHGRNSSFVLHVAESNTLLIVFLSRQKRLLLYKGSTSLQTLSHNSNKYKTTFNLVETLDPVESPKLLEALFPLPH